MSSGPSDPYSVRRPLAAPPSTKGMTDPVQSAPPSSGAPPSRELPSLSPYAVFQPTPGAATQHNSLGSSSSASTAQSFELRSFVDFEATLGTRLSPTASASVPGSVAALHCLSIEQRRFHVQLFVAAGNESQWNGAGDGFAGVHWHPDARAVHLTLMSRDLHATLTSFPLNADVQVARSSGTSFEWLQKVVSRRGACTLESVDLCAQLYEKIETGRDIETLVRDVDARQFWISHSGCRRAMEWNTFVSQLMRTPNLSKQFGDIALLQAVLRVRPEQPLVLLADFVNLVAWFGPFASILDKIRDVLGQPWFHSYLSRAEAEQNLLMNGQKGAFLVRFSTSEPGCFALSHEQHGEIMHNLISCLPDGTVSMVLSDQKALRHGTLVELIRSELGNRPICSVRREHHSSSPSASASSVKVAVYQFRGEEWQPNQTGVVTHSYEPSCRGVSLVVAEDTARFTAVITCDMQFSKTSDRSIVWQDHKEDRYAISFEKPEDCDALWTQLQYLLSMSPEKEAQLVWAGEQWPESVSWAAFVQGLQKHMGAIKQSDELVLKHIVYYSPAGPRAETIQLDDLAKFLSWFGPLGQAIGKLQEIMNYAWFHWFISRDQAEALLRDQRVGAFLFRFSSQRGAFALSYREQLGASVHIQHTLVQRDFHCGPKSFIMSKLGGGVLQYASLQELVDTERNKLVYPCLRA